MPPCRSPSSKHASKVFSSPASTKMTRPGASPACAIAGANRSCRVTHHRILPFVRAATPAVKSAAAAPSTAPFPPPATSCSAPSARPPPGSRPSISGTPNGNAFRTRASRPSRSWTRSRRSARTDVSGMRGIGWRRTRFLKATQPQNMFPFCSEASPRVNELSGCPPKPERPVGNLASNAFSTDLAAGRRTRLALASERRSIDPLGACASGVSPRFRSSGNDLPRILQCPSSARPTRRP